MGRWVETSTFWHGDLLHVERRPFTGWCAEGEREVGGTVQRVRVVQGEGRVVGVGDPDWAFLRVVVISAIVHAAFLMMIALTPRPKMMFLMEENVRDAELRAAILEGRSDQGTIAHRAVAAPSLHQPGIGGPKRIVIPTPPGSRVRSGSVDNEIRSAGLLAILGTSDSDSVFGHLISDGSYDVLTMAEGGLEGGVVGGVIGGRLEGEVGGLGIVGTGQGGGGIGFGTIGIGTIGTGCGALVDRLVERVFKDEKERSFAQRMCRLASTRGRDCLERALAAGVVSGPKLAERCADDLPSNLTSRLRSL